MRILHVGKFWPPCAGGVERAAHGLCTGLAARGVEVDVLAHATPGQWRGRSFDDHGVRVQLVGCAGQLAYTPLSPTFAPSLARLLRQRQPQLLHLHVPNPAAFWPLLLPAARRLPWVVHWHADIPVHDAPAAVRLIHPLYRPWQSALLARARRIIATSPPYRDASEPLALWREKTRVIPLGLAARETPTKTAIAAARGLWPSAGLRLLAVGRLSHYKGFDVLLRALARTNGIHLVLIGSGECATSLRHLRHELGLDDRVRLCGTLDDATRDAAYAAAQLFCLPSIARSEAFGMVLLEAMRARLPVIATRVAGTGMAYVTDDGNAGCLVAPGDVEALATALQRLAADPARRNALADAGHARWRAQFNAAASIDATLALYRELLDD